MSSASRRRDGRRGPGDEPLALTESLGVVADRLGVGRVDVVTAVFARWEELVGAGVAAHTRPLRVDGDRLVVAVDHPAWATQLRHLAPDVLRRVAEHCPPERAPNRLEVRVERR